MSGWTPEPVSKLGIDEIAIRKGHNYATVFYDSHEDGKMLKGTRWLIMTNKRLRGNWNGGHFPMLAVCLQFCIKYAEKRHETLGSLKLAV